ncbi:MAG: hypothetical protein SPE18_05570 [Candidatus Limivicinus sp.]|nr:hypothetical protein [Candidatus Limivicinus sp.]
MTIVEKAAYLKGLTEGLGISPDSKEGKLWGALNELLSDMAHEIEDLQASNLDFAEALDDISEDLTYLEELTCDLDMPEDMMDEEGCSGDCSSCLLDCGAEDEDEEDDEELSYDGVMYEVTCPVCGEEIAFDEDTLAEGSTTCPGCGETLEFDLDSDDE